MLVVSPYYRTPAVLLLSLFTASCGGLTTLSPTGPATTFASNVTASGSPALPAPVPAPPGIGSISAAHTITGTVPALGSGVLPCWADRYPCEVFEFALAQTGPIEVTLTWDGQPRALMVQLYWAGEGLAHEDLAPRTGPSRINFRRPLMEAANYRLRVVSLEPERAVPYSLTVNY
jgi:hypothetical protein